jgi:hypothetical protein
VKEKAKMHATAAAMGTLIDCCITIVTERKIY